MNLLPIQPSDVYQTFADTEDLFKIIDYKPVIRFGKGVKNSVDWYKEFYNI